MKDTSIDATLKCIMALQGVEAFKETVLRLHGALADRDAGTLRLPNYLWAIRRGGGVSTLARLFTAYLHAEQAIEFCGRAHSFEFALEYAPPGAFFSGLAQLDAAFKSMAGHRHRFKGVVYINVDAWVEHTNETHFKDFLQYVAGTSRDVLTIFCVSKPSKTVEVALAAHMRIETLTLRFPNADELFAWMEQQCLRPAEVTLTKGAGILLTESIAKIAAGSGFLGFKSIQQFAEDILHHALVSGSGMKRITAQTLSHFRADGVYVQRTSVKSGTSKIGYHYQGGEPAP